MSGAVARIRRMRGTDLERVLEIAEGLREAPHWTAGAYHAAMDVGSVPQRVALVAECDSGRDWESREISAETSPQGLKPNRVPQEFVGTAEAVPFQSEPIERAGWVVVGFVVAAIVAGEAELETIAVGEAEQRRGVGGRLLESLVEELRDQQVRNVNLEVRASNRRAIGFYGTHGFKESGRRKRYYADPEEDAVLMRLALS
jgi:ribosomal-protein-alanine acetyltransferase